MVPNKGTSFAGAAGPMSRFALIRASMFVVPQYDVNPPSTSSVWPVTEAAAGLAR
jgi:hypothetical protein